MCVPEFHAAANDACLGDWTAAHLEEVGGAAFESHRERRTRKQGESAISPSSPLSALGVGGNAWSLEGTCVVLAGEEMLCLKHDTEDGRSVSGRYSVA